MVDISPIIEKKKRYIWDIETTGLEPFEHRILCISILDTGNDEIKSFQGEDEKKILEDFWDAVKYAKELIGYNSHSFDYQFVLKRSLFYGVKIVKIKHIDLRKEASGFWEHYEKKVTGKLSDWAEKLGVTIETDNGNKMPGLYLGGKWDDIRCHCEEDIKIVKLLYDRCKHCGVL